MQYDRLPRLTSTIIWISRRFAPGGANRRPIRLPGFQGGEISVVKILAVGTRSRRGTGTSRSSRLLLRGRGLRLRRLDLEDRRRDEHDQLTARGLRGRLLEQPPDDGNIAEERDLPRLVLVQVRRDAADDQTLTFLDQDLGFRLALVDDRRGAGGGTEVHGRVAARVVLDRDLHLDPGDVAFAYDGRNHFEHQHRFLELDLRTGGADGRVRDFFTERDRGGAVFHGDDLGARQRPCLAEQAWGAGREVDVVAAPGAPERDT